MVGESTTIRDKRIERGLSQQTLGEMLGIRGPAAQVRVSQWETGAAKIPRGKIMVLSKLLEINPTDLI